MFNKNFIVWGVIASTAVLTGCDDDYDLADIDTTSRFDVKDLVVPVNIDKATLKSIFSIDEDDPDARIKVFHNPDGTSYYAIEENGTFESDGIKVDPVTAAAPTIEDPAPSPLTPLGSAGGAVKYAMESDMTDFTLVTDPISSSILSIDHATGALSIRAVLTLTGASFSSFDMDNLVIQLPRGLQPDGLAQGGSYDPQTGHYTIGHLSGSGNSVALDFKAKGVDFTVFDPSPFDDTSRIITYRGTMGVISGDLSARYQGTPVSVTLSSHYTCSAFEATAFSGRIKYVVENLDVNDVDLSDIPDVFKQDANIVLVNPYIFLDVDNPLEAAYDVYAESGMTITANRGDEEQGEEITHTPWTMPGTFTVGKDGAAPHVLLAVNPAEYQSAYPDATCKSFPDLGKILSGEGVPASLSIDMTGAVMPDQYVNDFLLGHDYGPVKGDYKFHAPLEFAEGAYIYYTDTLDGWRDDDLDHLTITNLIVNADIASDIPAEMILTAYPIDKEGHQLAAEASVTIDPSVNAKAVSFGFTGPITKLDGMYFTAHAADFNDNKVLSPDMSISFSNIRPRVSGFYEKKL